MVRLKADAAVVLILLVTGACAPVNRLRNALLQKSPYQRYVGTLMDAGIHKSILGARWIAAGERALSITTNIKVPHRSIEIVLADEPSALSYRLDLRRGQVYQLDLSRDAADPVYLFADLFRINPGREPEHVAGVGPPHRRLEYEPDEDEVFVLRVQAALLEDGQVALSHRLRAALLFPVAQHGRRHIQSLFGSARDRGAREHHGIDIFAPRGTPAVAAADGWVTSTSPNRLGGNVVWLWDPHRNQTLYYAHLDRSTVFPGQRVKKGDIVGNVGNTGNARNTSPHLHFGIYRRGRGPIDPLYYLVDPPP